MDLLLSLIEPLSAYVMLGQTGQEQYESGRMWYRIGAVLVALAGLIGGLGLMFYKDKPEKPTDPRVLLFARFLGLCILVGCIGIAIYMFATT